MKDYFDEVRQNLIKAGIFKGKQITSDSEGIVNIPIIGKIIPDKKLGNKVIYEPNDPKEKEDFKKAFGEYEE